MGPKQIGRESKITLSFFSIVLIANVSIKFEFPFELPFEFLFEFKYSIRSYVHSRYLHIVESPFHACTKHKACRGRGRANGGRNGVYTHVTQHARACPTKRRVALALLHESDHACGGRGRVNGGRNRLR